MERTFGPPFSLSWTTCSHTQRNEVSICGEKEEKKEKKKEIRFDIPTVIIS